MTVIEIAVLRAKKDISTGNARALERWLPVIKRYAAPVPVGHASEAVSMENLAGEQLRAVASIKLGRER